MRLKTSHLLLYISISTLVGMGGCGNYEKRASEYYDKGQDLFHQEDFAEAKRKFNIVAFSFRHSPLATNSRNYIDLCEAGGIALKAREFFFEGNLQEASRLASLALEKERNMPIVLFVNGLVAYKSGQQAQAEGFFEQLKANPECGDYVSLAYAAAHLINQRYYKAQEGFVQAFNQSQVRSIKELALRALAMVRLSIPVEGARNLTQIFPYNHPDKALICLVTGQLYSTSEGKNYELAERYLRQAANLTPGTRVGADAQITLANLLLEKPGEQQTRVDNYKEALLLAKNALQYYPDDPNYLFTSQEAERVLSLIAK